MGNISSGSSKKKKPGDFETVPFTLKQSPLEGLVIIEPSCFSDERGFFMETFRESELARHGLSSHFVQDNQSESFRGVLRGLHFQREPNAQAKLVRVIRGAAWDVAVDIRPKSKSYGRWFGLELSEENKLMLYIPEGFAHGFVALRDNTGLVYKCSAEYNKEGEGGIRWDDRDLAVAWPMREVIVSKKDLSLPRFKDLV